MAPGRAQQAWLNRTFRLLAEELSPGEEPVSVSVLAETGGEVVSYTIAYGVPGVIRRVILDAEALAAAADGATVDVTVDVPE